MGLTLGATGKLMMRNGKLFTDENGYDCCCGGCVCNCDILNDIHNQTHPTYTSLKIHFDFPASCSASDQDNTLTVGGVTAGGCIGFSLADAVFADFAEGTGVALSCNGDDIILEFTQPNPGTCMFGAATLISYTCGMFNLEIVFEVEIVSGFGPPAFPCSCEGQVVTVTITPQ